MQNYNIFLTYMIYIDKKKVLFFKHLNNRICILNK